MHSSDADLDMQAQWEVRVMAHKLQTLTDRPDPQAISFELGRHATVALMLTLTCVVQAQWEMRVMAQKLQTMTDRPVPSGDVSAQLNTCRDDSAQLR